jgi:hypothetical protein
MIQIKSQLKRADKSCGCAKKRRPEHVLVYSAQLKSPLRSDAMSLAKFGELRPVGAQPEIFSRRQWWIRPS